MYVLILALSLAGPAFATDPAPPPAVVAAPAPPSAVVSQDTLTQYDAIRAALATDKLDNAASLAATLAAASTADPTLAAAATAIAQAPDATGRRNAFGELSRLLLNRIGAESAPPKVLVYFCPMWSGFAWWIQLKSGISNPYMGTSMPTCGSEMSMRAAVKAAAAPPR